ncbi:MAG: hydroxymethylpyrimidine/phosphomethylpyrimidine kinase [Bacteroidota bacterium]|nr:hydroxymethylpyrimidine/phosphomethylpyrimidine kinase [Bacteroidota bacterium]
MRNFVLTIAGFDPSSGAGLTADIKTFEQHKIYGLSVCTAITLQTEDAFYTIRWEKIEDVLTTLDILLTKHAVSVIKTGILPSIDYLNKIVSFIHSKYPNIKIIVDPILKSSTGFNFIQDSDKNLFYSILEKCYLITPNIDEAKIITGNTNETAAAKEISTYCNVFLKGGHSIEKPGVDYLYSNNEIVEVTPTSSNTFPKHGSGCILSAAITANLALGSSLIEACKLSKKYIETVLSSNETLLAYHNV